MKLTRAIKKYNPWLVLRMLLKSLNRARTLKFISALEPSGRGNTAKYIVSLTSYGKRLTDTAPYAVATLLSQSVKPDRIVLWVGHKDMENIPEIMGKLVEKGLEIRFCEDIKAYTKLIHSLTAFPGQYVITADDDIFYPRRWLEQLISEHNKNPKKIICHRVHGIKVDENHNLLPYDDWDWSVSPKQWERVFPTGVGGILYPPGCFYKDITDKELFTELSPHNDDIWYWAMTVINKEYFGGESPYAVIENSCNKDLWYIDFMGQLNGGALWNYNCTQGGNDIQLKAVIERYPRIRETLDKIEVV